MASEDLRVELVTAHRPDEGPMQIDVQINLGALVGEMQRAMQRATFLVAAGLQSPVDLDPERLAIKTSGIAIQVGQGGVWLPESPKRDYEEWVLASGFRDAIEATGTFLESVRSILAYWELGKRQLAGQRLNTDIWREVFDAGTKRFHRLGMPDKITHLESEFGVRLAAPLDDCLLTANVARNCLVHRLGIVSERDLNESELLVVKWRRYALIVEDQNGQTELAPGLVAKGPASLLLQMREGTKSFRQNDRVSFTADEFVEICTSLFLYSAAWAEHLSEVGMRLGFLPRRDVA